MDTQARIVGWLAAASVLVLAGCTPTLQRSEPPARADRPRPAEPAGRGVGAGEEVVFVAPSRAGTAIHAVKPDGSSPRQVFALPDYAPADAAIWELSASPSGARLAFASNHDWNRSLFVVDTFVVDIDGQNLRRPSNAPSIPQLDAYERGKVIVDARRLVRGGELSAYVQGARAPVTALLREGQSTVFELEAADLGPGVRQQVRIFNHHPGPSHACHFDPAVMVDVRAGRTTDAGPMPMLGAHTCPTVRSPGWIDDDTLAVLYAEATTSISPNHNIWTVRADIGPGEAGTRWYDTSRQGASSKIVRVFAGESEGPEPTIVAFRSGAIATWILAAPVADPASMAGGHATLCGASITCKLTSIDSTPDGSVTVISTMSRQATGPMHAALHLARNDGPYTEIVGFDDGFIGTAAISPNGEHVVFDRARAPIDTYERVLVGERPQCPCSIWRVGADGTGLTKLVEDGRSPDWTR